MKTLLTTLDAVEAIFQVLKSAAIVISGSIYRFQRPINSVEEDIVIIPVTPLTADQMQKGVLNVNVYVPSLDLPSDKTQPNVTRFNDISKDILIALDDQYGYNYNFKTETAGELIPSNIGWFMNIRVEFNAFRGDGMVEQGTKYFDLSKR